MRRVAKKKSRRIKPRSTLDPTKLALAALDRIRAVLDKAGHADRMAEPLKAREIAARRSLFGEQHLPPSYLAAMREAGSIGDPEDLLTAGEMATRAAQLAAQLMIDPDAYVPFCVAREQLFCFARAGRPRDGEMPVVELEDGKMVPAAHNFGEWLDAVADAREAVVANAGSVPARLKRLLLELGFRFDYPVIGRLETADTDAILELVGPTTAREIRGDRDRLFDSSGKASMTINVDEFTLAVSLRTGIFLFEADDVFRWLRYFRDENFFGEDQLKEPSHPDQVRDLRRAPREPPIILRGEMEMPSLAARRYQFRAASGEAANDYYLLGRTSSRSEHAPSVLVRVVNGQVATAHALDEPLNELYVPETGAIWGLSQTCAVSFDGTRARSYPLVRPTPGRAWWYGIGGLGDRVIVWGAGALLEFDGRGFVPFRPDAGLDDGEHIVATSVHDGRLSMLVCGDEMGAIATFDGRRWTAIDEAHVMEGQLVGMDGWRGTNLVLSRVGGVFRVEQGSAPRAVVLDRRAQAFVSEAGARRGVVGLAAYDGGMLVGSEGGVIEVPDRGGPNGDPLFHAAQGCIDPARLCRVGTDAADPAIVCVVGPHVWTWHRGRFSVLDLRAY